MKTRRCNVKSKFNLFQCVLLPTSFAVLCFQLVAVNGHNTLLTPSGKVIHPTGLNKETDGKQPLRTRSLYSGAASKRANEAPTKAIMFSNSKPVMPSKSQLSISKAVVDRKVSTGNATKSSQVRWPKSGARNVKRQRKRRSNFARSRRRTRKNHKRELATRRDKKGKRSVKKVSVRNNGTSKNVSNFQGNNATAGNQTTNGTSNNVSNFQGNNATAGNQTTNGTSKNVSNFQGNNETAGNQTTNGTSNNVSNFQGNNATAGNQTTNGTPNNVSNFQGNNATAGNQTTNGTSKNVSNFQGNNETAGNQRNNETSKNVSNFQGNNETAGNQRNNGTSKNVSNFQGYNATAGNQTTNGTSKNVSNFQGNNATAGNQTNHHPCNSIQAPNIDYKVGKIECRRWQNTELQQEMNCRGMNNHQYLASSFKEALNFKDLDTGRHLDLSQSSFILNSQPSRRQKRSVRINPGETLIVQCHGGKTPTPSGHLRICPVCMAITRQPSTPRRFPEYINELLCDPQMVSTYLPGIGAFCVQKTLTLDLLQFTGLWELNAALTVEAGHDVYTEKWEVYTQTIRRHCACELLPSSPMITLL